MLNKELRLQEINRLCSLYCERRKEFKKARIIRHILTIIGFSIVYFVIFMVIWGNTDIEEMLEYVANIGLYRTFLLVLISVALAVLHIFINGSLFATLIQKHIAEDRRLDAIMKQIQELEKSE